MTKAIGLEPKQWALVTAMLYHALEDLGYGIDDEPGLLRDARAKAVRILWNRLSNDEREEMFPTASRWNRPE